MQNPSPYHFQAHRGGMDEVDENTVEAMLYGWSFPNSIPETDVRMLKDGSLVCLHDETLQRTTKTKTPLSTKAIAHFSYKELNEIDPTVPLLKEVLEKMQNYQSRLLYLEIKDAPLEKVIDMLKEYDVLNQIIFVHKEQTFCIDIQRILPEALTMSWCSGDVQQIQNHFEKLHLSGFKGISEVQIHFPTSVKENKVVTHLPESFLDHALKATKKYNRVLQLCPFTTSPVVLGYLYKKGVRSFVSDAPKAFSEAMKKVLSS